MTCASSWTLTIDRGRRTWLDVLVDTPFGDIVVSLMVSKGIVVALTRSDREPDGIRRDGTEPANRHSGGCAPSDGRMGEPARLQSRESRPGRGGGAGAAQNGLG
jgi:hypothetical protein